MISSSSSVAYKGPASRAEPIPFQSFLRTFRYTPLVSFLLTAAKETAQLQSLVRQELLRVCWWSRSVLLSLHGMSCSSCSSRSRLACKMKSGAASQRTNVDDGVSVDLQDSGALEGENKQAGGQVHDTAEFGAVRLWTRTRLCDRSAVPALSSVRAARISIHSAFDFVALAVLPLTLLAHRTYTRIFCRPSTHLASGQT